MVGPAAVSSSWTAEAGAPASASSATTASSLEQDDQRYRGERRHPRLAAVDARGAQVHPPPDAPHRADDSARQLKLAHGGSRQHDGLEEVVEGDQEQDPSPGRGHDLEKGHRSG